MYIFQPDRHLLREQIKRNARYMKGRVLDVGAGDFSRYEKMFRCDEYVKMDVKKNDNVDVVGSADNIPFPDRSFDSVFCTQVFEHLPDPFKAAGEIFRVLKNGGMLIVTVPQCNELHEEPHDYFRYTKYGLERIFSKAGFEIEECEQRGGFFTLKAQLNIRYLIDRFNLYKRGWYVKIISKSFHIYSKIMVWFDRVDKSNANRKHTIGWCVVFKKS